MLKFLKYSLATFVGALAALFVIGIVTLIIVAVSMSGSNVEVKDNSVLVIKLDGQIVDRTTHNPLENLNPLNRSNKDKQGLTDIIQALELAETDSNIKGVLLKIEYPNAGISTLSEIRDALSDFKNSGKFIISYSDFYSQKAYYVSSIADKVYLNPEGMLLFKGLSLSTMFVKNTFEKLGIKPQIIRHGKYKSAVEIFTEEEMSDESRYQINELVTDVWQKVKNDISASRYISVSSLDSYADNLSVRLAEDAVEKGLVDGLKYYDEILNDLQDSLSLDKNEDIPFIGLNKYIETVITNNLDLIDNEGKPEVAVIVAQGNIVPGEGDKDNIGGDKLAHMIRKARTDDNVRAIVLRINSGGGSALASEVIWRESYLAAKEKSFVVSMGDAAASGGYYIAAPADVIVANPTTITGSIGVFGVFFSGAELLEKIGISNDVVNTNKNSDIGSFSRPMNDVEVEVLQIGIEDIYSTFITHVAEGRRMDIARVDSLGQGRVWTGQDAQEIGLVDMYGGLKSAIKVAIDMENLADTVYTIQYYPKAVTSLSAILEELGSSTKTNYLESTLGDKYMYLKSIQEAENREGIQTKLPFEYTID